VLAVPLLVWASGWTGWRHLAQMFPDGRVDLASLTGNRYGEGGVIRPLVEAVLADHPWTGYSATGLATSVDSAPAQALMLAGLVGVALLAVALMWLPVALARRWRSLDTAERWLYGPLVVGVVVLSAGSPVLTANRVAVVLWALLALLLTTPPGPARATSRSGEWRRRPRRRPAPSRE
jgi:hypothetical protein